jgi:CheY-like chemotaxis protein
VISVNAVVEDTMLLLRRLLGENIIMQLALTASPTTVRADAGQLKQVLMNLAVNARDAMSSGGTLTLATVRRQVESPADAAALHLPIGDYIELKVTDTGVGMSEDVRSHLFEPFFTTKPVGKGTGLGLSMVYGIVTQAGGQLQVDSTEGVGSSFRAFLPALPADVIPVDDTAVLPSRNHHHGTETLLVAEDEAGVRDFIARTLTRLGYTVLAADCGAEAVRLASEHAGTIDLLIADVVMPDFGGRPLWDALSAARPDLRVLFISGYSDDNTMAGLTSTAEAFMHKPFGVDALGARVRALLDASAPAERTAESPPPSR